MRNILLLLRNTITNFKKKIYINNNNVQTQLKRKKDGMIILECLVLHTLPMVMQHEKQQEIFHRT